MKVAYHFKCSEIKERYDRLFYSIVFSKLIGFKEQFVSTKVLVGDLIKHDILREIRNPDIFIDLLFQTDGDNWKRIVREKSRFFYEQEVFVICFETIQKELADKIHKSLISDSNYLGALEIDNSYELHWWLYGECIVPRFRILNKDIYVLLEGDTPESQDLFEHFKQLLNGIPFNHIYTEYSNYRYTLLDDNHNFENAKRATEWKKSTDSLFLTITDEIIAKLTDAAPELTDRLWTINHTFLTAQTGEQYALAMTACRRLFEYVIDCLFPANNEIIEGHSLKKDKYKNRLFEFAKREMKSEVNIELIVTNTSSLFDDWAKLYELSNKGVHSEPHRQECRRCILRTILLLDDLIAIKSTPFDVKVKADNYINEIIDKKNACR